MILVLNKKKSNHIVYCLKHIHFCYGLIKTVVKGKIIILYLKHNLFIAFTEHGIKIF